MANLEILMEYFAGNRRDKRFKQCEEQLQILIDEMKPNQDLSHRYNIMKGGQNFTNHPANLKLRSLLAGIFNTRTVKIYWDRGTINAYTLPPMIFYKVTNRKNYKSSNPKHNNINMHIVLFEELITVANLNAKELMAVILHEIGHNFSVIPCRFVSEILRCTLWLPQVVYMKLGAAINSEVDRWMYDELAPVNNFLNVVNDVVGVVFGILNSVSPIALILKILKGGKLKISWDPVFLLDDIGSYQDEKASDSFAATYGYGPYLISGLEKFSTAEFDTTNQILKKVGLLDGYRLLTDVNSLIIEPLLSILLEPHPNANVRYHNVKRKLEHDLKTGDYPKEYKKELEEQIQEMDKLYELVGSYSEPEKIRLRKSFYKMMDIATRGHSDWREIFDIFQKDLNF